VTEATICPIRYLGFICEGCGVEWTLHMDPPLTSCADLLAFTDRGGMGPCPKNCGAKTCSLMIRVRKG
jgi:hypothetical protein